MNLNEARGTAATVAGWLYSLLRRSGELSLLFKVRDVLPLGPRTVGGVDQAPGAVLVLASGLRLVLRVDIEEESARTAIGGGS